MERMNDKERLYKLFSIFDIFSDIKEFNILSSHAFSDSLFWKDESGQMQKALKYILKNFQKQISMKDLLEITNMSNSAFYDAFKHTYRMPYKDYLLNIRVGYACKLLTEASQNIARIAYDSGFENISNFNRQFKKIKGITPSQFREQIYKIEKENIKADELN
jgi:AraC-like DNA-binding protein